MNLKSTLLAFLSVLISSTSYAQLPICSGSGSGIIYYVSGTNIYNYNPTLPISATNPSLNTISLPTGAVAGLAYSQNLNAVTPSPTFYTISGATNEYYYYNGTGWTATGHTAGSVNIGGGGPYIYGLSGSNVTRYNGTANATTVVTMPPFSGVADVQGDVSGGFYVLRTGAPQSMDYYNAAGTLAQTWSLIGAPVAGNGGGFGIIGSKVYYNNSSGLYEGVIGPTSITFTVITATGLVPGPADFAVCGATISVLNTEDTVYYCGNGAGVTLTASGTNGPYNWTVISGPATITGNTNTVVVNTTANAVIRRTSNNVGSSITQTTHILIPGGSLDAGPDHNVVACGLSVRDTLHATFTGTSPGIPYTLAWTPAASILSGGNTLNPITNLTGTTTFTVTASVPAAFGGCTFKDSVKSTFVYSPATAAFDFAIKYGCAADTIVFNNQSTPSGLNYNWSFGNGQTSTALNPTIIYPQQDTYAVKLVARNLTCRDSVTKRIDLRHPLVASFTNDKDTLCMGDSVAFTNTSVASTINGIAPSYFWDFGDRYNSILPNPVHTYLVNGTYKVMLVVKDFVPCYDTFYKTIVVDSLPSIGFTVSDTVLCQGQQIAFTGFNSVSSLSSIAWDFGDGSFLTSAGSQVSHAFETAGLFTISVTGNYLHCSNITRSASLRVKPYPRAYVGADTFLCPNGQPIRLAETMNAGNPDASFRWNNGITASSILVNAPGVYAATVNIEGCSTTDSVTVFNDCYLSIPNIFTPNGDGVNDYFFPASLKSHATTSLRIAIYNRLGQLVYQSSRNDQRGWDGRFNDQPQPQGVFIYMIDATFTDGHQEQFKGNVTLIR